MKTVLGLFLFSVLLATGESSECETCFGLGNSCTGQKETCSLGLDTCQTIVYENTVGEHTFSSIVKSCSFKSGCEQLKPGKTYNFDGTSSVIKEVTCKVSG